MAVRTSYAQFVTMVDFMEKNGDLSKPTGGPRGRQWCNLKWRELTETLNSEGAGESRNEDRWRKVWSDLKNNTKKKWAKTNKSVKGTGGGPALKMTLTDLENRVMTIMGVQAAARMPVPEVGFAGQTEEELMEENWNTPSTSTDPIPHTSQLLLTPCLGPEVPRALLHLKQGRPLFCQLQLPQPPKKSKRVEEIFLQCEKEAREYNRETDRMYAELERERIRQREDELPLQAQWLQFMKEALSMIGKYLDGKNDCRKLAYERKERHDFILYFYYNKT